MDGRLFAAALKKYLAGFAVVELLLFIPAGTLAWWQGYQFITAHRALESA